MTIKETVTDVAENLLTSPVSEGKWTKRIENQTAKIPSIFFLNLAFSAIAFSALYKLLKPKSTVPNFMGHWVPTFLILGLYNKLVKLEGNDRFNHA